MRCYFAAGSRALFPLLVGIERRGSIGVFDLADAMTGKATRPEIDHGSIV